MFLRAFRTIFPCHKSKMARQMMKVCAGKIKNREKKQEKLTEHFWSDSGSIITYYRKKERMQRKIVEKS